MSGRVAVVHHDRSERRVVRACLDDVYEIVEYGDAFAALSGLAADRPDLVLLDDALPGLGGTELLRRLRANPRVAWIPVVALTTDVSAGHRERRLAAGFDGCVATPVVDETRLRRAIAEQLRAGPLGVAV